MALSPILGVKLKHSPIQLPHLDIFKILNPDMFLRLIPTQALIALAITIPVIALTGLILIVAKLRQPPA